jgi:hypothetical protein
MMKNLKKNYSHIKINKKEFLNFLDTQKVILVERYKEKLLNFKKTYQTLTNKKLETKENINDFNEKKRYIPLLIKGTEQMIENKQNYQLDLNTKVNLMLQSHNNQFNKKNNEIKEIIHNIYDKNEIEMETHEFMNNVMNENNLLSQNKTKNQEILLNEIIDLKNKLNSLCIDSNIILDKNSIIYNRLLKTTFILLQLLAASFILIYFNF